MAVAKLLNLLAISCLAIIASYGPTPVVAVSVTPHHARNNFHAELARRARSETSKRCRPRTRSSVAVSNPTVYATPPPSSPPSPPPSPSKSSPQPSYKPVQSGGSDSAPKPKPPSSGGGNGGSKVGIAWPLGNDRSIQNFKTPKVDMYYTWSPWCVKAADDVGMQCCPMLWGDKQIGQFTSLVKAGYAKCVMGFNEPDQPGQANMSPEHAVQLWRQYIDPLKAKGFMTISPATTSSPNGKKWMVKFMDLCQGCQIDRIATHWYGTKSQAFIDYVQDIYNTFKKPIYITEFACQDFSGGSQCSKDQVFSFMETVTNWMDNTWYVEQYFAFGAMHDMYNVNPLNRLLGGDGKPTDLGFKYIYG